MYEAKKAASVTAIQKILAVIDVLNLANRIKILS